MRYRPIIEKWFRYISFSLIIVLLLLLISCNKLVQVPNPISSVTSSQVFSSDPTAISAILGIYSNMSANSSFVNNSTTIFSGLSADELTDETSGNEISDIFLSNQLTALSASSYISGTFWQPAYFDIYNANAIIAGTQTSTGMSIGVKNELVAEAKFIRAFCYFYLTNLIGDLPLVLDIDFNKTVLLGKTSQAKIYQQIIADLLNAENSLPDNLLLSGGMPIRANKWAAAALLGRVYLYQGLWKSADSAATSVINSGQFSLVSLDSVFLANSPEAILQLQTPNNYPYATIEGNLFNPYPGSTPAFWLTSQLLGAFEPNDLRRTYWVDSTTDNNGSYYYYPYKYKVQVGQGYPSTENYTLLRYAEQYLIRAEAEANLGQLIPAINDLNTIRSRAGLDSLPSALGLTQILAAVQQENRVEFFAEWGHRWLDLKRWGIAIQTLDTISYKRGYIDSTQLLYPIPIMETQTDPNLTQNHGY